MQTVFSQGFYKWINSSKQKSLHLLRNVSVEGLISHFVIKSQKMLMIGWNMDLQNLAQNTLLLYSIILSWNHKFGLDFRYFNQGSLNTTG